MKGMLSIVLVTFLLIGQAVAQEQPKAKTGAMSEKEKLSYSLGYKTGRDIMKYSVEIDIETFSSAVRDSIAGGEAAMTEKQMHETLTALQKKMKTQQAEKRKGLAEENKKEGEVFLKENAKKQGVVSLPSGLQYKIIKEGTGKQPAKADKVEVHYRGTLLSGAEFYDSHKDIGGKPVTNDVNKFIKGMVEALQLMKEGSKWILYTPSNLAYGERGLKRLIGPNQALIFEVELIAVHSQTPKAGI